MRRKYEIRAKKTEYGGILFRSKIEAQWAVFYDCLDIIYEYEPLCLEVETGCRVVTHKPDFILKTINKYAEIKPSKPIDTESTKAAGWAKHVDDIVVFFNLSPPTDTLENGWLFTNERYGQPPRLSEGYWWAECPKCGHIDIEEYAQITSCECFSAAYYNKLYEKEELNGVVGHLSRTPRLLAAYKVARNYDFTKSRTKRASKLPVQHEIFKKFS